MPSVRAITAEWHGHQVAQNDWWYVKLFWYRVQTIDVTDRQQEGWTELPHHTLLLHPMHQVQTCKKMDLILFPQNCGNRNTLKMAA